jgi:3-oxoacyl-[acyl-carrier protein] reductase
MAKVILITGTRKGIGQELSQYYLSQGDIVVGCSRGEASIQHPNYEHYCLDVADEKQVVHMVKATQRTHGSLNVLINNAGIASMNHLLLTPYSTAKTIFETNFFGTFLLLREAGKLMVNQKQGRIVNFSTIATPLRLEGEALYAASKAAIESLTQIAARELAPFNITVNAIGPTPIPTDLIRSVPQEKMDALLNQQAIKRFGSWQDVANAIDFFIDEKSSFITGQVLYLGGVNG